MQCWGGLSLGQSVDAVVVDDVGHVYVPPSSMNEMSNSNAQPITVSPNRDYFEIWIGQLGTLRIT